MRRPRLSHPLTRITLLAALPLLALLGWYVWSPGLDLRDGTHDVGHNGLWMQHGWFADDLWFKAGGAKNRESRKAFFRDPATLAKTADFLRQYHIGDLFPHLCPCNSDGTLPRVDHPQVERFLDAFSDFRVFPWVGGIRGESAFPENPTWRRTFISSCNELLHRHPRFAGIHINIEPVPSGDRDFLTLLDELGAAIPVDKLISVGAYPPPTRWHPFPNVHWDEAYSREVGQRANHIVVMMYDTSLHNEKLYRNLMDDWTTEVLAWYPRDEVLLGIPAYDDSAPPLPWHDPKCENIDNALMGIHAALAGIAGGSRPPNYRGVAIYDEWDMTADKWFDFQVHFLNTPPATTLPEGPTTAPSNPLDFNNPNP